MDLESLIKHELLKEINEYLNETECVENYLTGNKISIVYQENYRAALEVLRLDNENIALITFAYGSNNYEIFEELDLLNKLLKIINSKSGSILNLSLRALSLDFQTANIEYKTNNFSQYHNDMANRLNSLLDTTPVLDGYLLTMAKSELVNIKSSILGESPLSIVITDRKINSIEEKALENILNRIRQYCKQYSFKMVKGSKPNVINIAHTEEKKSIDVETVVDKFLNKPIEDIAPGDE